MIYFDNAASSKPDKDVLDCFLNEANLTYANPSSRHAYGREANKRLEKARQSILRALNVEKTHRLIFTSGASESNNLAIKGVAENYIRRGKRIITSSVEHPSVLETFRALEKNGFEVVYLPVNGNGEVEPEALKAAMNNETTLVSIMASNNETGSNNDIKKLAEIVHEYPKAFFHVDVTQAIGKEDLPYEDIDLFSFSGHKIHGLKGTGALLIKNKVLLTKQIDGGDQEYALRAGTDNFPGDASLALAVEKIIKGLPANVKHAQEISSYLRAELENNPEIIVNSPLNCNPFILNFSFKHKKASVITEALSHEEIYVSSVSACNSKGEPVSYVLEAMGKGKEIAMNSIRISFSGETSMDEAKEFITKLNEIIERTIDR